MELDMTKGKPMGLMLRFLIPVAIGNIFQQLYNTVDSIIGVVLSVLGLLPQ